ncbi:MAG: S1/P1 Nuclease [Caulobacteraceae bacterium]|nr:S1/P1 Nuclease [Caulobacteraceae bacterium]
MGMGSRWRRAALAASALGVLALGALVPHGAALAWGSTGHRIIGRLGVATLPEEVPAFLRSQQSIEAVGELAREPDRWRNAGKTHDNFRDPGHFIDVDDNGRILGGPALAALPLTRSDYETALRAVGTESGHAGFLPYSIIDGWQQLAKDFAYWRVLTAAIPRETNPERKAWMQADLKRRETLIVHDLGIWAHYVGDASQPMHASVHYNGWGDYPNPEGYTQDRVHVPFEGPFVQRNVSEKAVRAAMTAPQACDAIEVCTARYLGQTAATMIPFFKMQKAGGLTGAHPAGVGFTVDRLAAGASELRDLTVAAWEASAKGGFGYPPVTVDQVVREGVDPWTALYGDD